MNSFTTLQKFHDAILENTPLSVKSDIKPGGRMHVYTDGYRIRLSHAIRTDYPALMSVLGTAAFNHLALRYAEEHPSTRFNLDHYPQGFCAYVEQMVDNHFARELAKLENTIAVVFAAKESQALSPDLLSHMTPESFATMRLYPRKASQLISFTYPVNDWLSAWNAQKNPPIPDQSPEYAYIYRHHNAVQRVILLPLQFILLQQLMGGSSVESAVANIFATETQHAEEILVNLQSWFAIWLEKGFFRIDS